MVRSREAEILDDHSLPEPVVARAYRDLTRLHRVLGTSRRLIRAIRRDPLPVRRVLDIGCAYGEMLEEIRDRLGVEVIGVDLHPPAHAAVPIVTADAIRDPLPAADIAICVCLGHHLSEPELAALICNVGRYCRRLLLVDLVRHPLPLALFRLFVAPFFSPVAIADGMSSVRRAYTGGELAHIAQAAGAPFEHSIAPFYVSQTIDVRYPPARYGPSALLHSKEAR